MLDNGNLTLTLQDANQCGYVKKLVDRSLQGPKVDTPMHDPRTSVIGSESNRNIVTGTANTNHITPNRVCIIVRRAASTAHDAEGVLMKLLRTPIAEERRSTYTMQMNRML